MKKWLLISIIVLNLSLSALGVDNRNKRESSVSMDVVKEAILDKKENVTIVDVRDANSYAKGHIDGAINIPYDKYGKFQRPEMQFPGLNKNGVNYVYCYTLKCRLAERACKMFNSMGYPSKEIHGGFDNWAENRYPVAVSLPNRQVN